MLSDLQRAHLIFVTAPALGSRHCGAGISEIMLDAYGGCWCRGVMPHGDA